MGKARTETMRMDAADQFEVIFKRIQTATGTRTQIELAALLEIRQSSISDAKRRKSIPIYWMHTLMEKCGINPYWIKYGEEPMHLPKGGLRGLPLSDNACATADLEILIKELIGRLAPEDMAEDAKRTLCLKGFHLEPTDTVSDILKKVLPGIVAAKVCDHIFRTSFLTEHAEGEEGNNE